MGTQRLRERFWRRLCPAERLLLAVTRGGLGDDWGERARCLAGSAEVAWPQVFETAVLHQVTPLVYRNLKDCDALARAPDSVVAAFRQAAALNVQRKEQLAAARDEAIQFFAQHRLPVLLVKGTALDVRLPGEAWWTVSGDVDLLVACPRAELSDAVIERMLEMNAAKPPVDVHCGQHSDLDMNGLLAIDYPRLVEQASPHEVGASDVLLMTPEDELLCACIQSFRKRYFRLKSLYEIAALLDEEPTLDWEVIARRAAAWRCAWIVFTALTAAAASVGCRIGDAELESFPVPRARRALIRGLVARMSCGSLGTLFGHREVRGKRIGRSLLLPYASQPLGQLWHSARIVSGQMRRE